MGRARLLIEIPKRILLLIIGTGTSVRFGGSFFRNGHFFEFQVGERNTIKDFHVPPEC